MAKTLRKRVAKRVRKGAKTAGRSISRFTSDGALSAAKVAGVAVAGMAGVAGVVAAARRLRSSTNGKATMHVRTEGDQWVIVTEDGGPPIGVFPTKEEAVHVAREAAAGAAPSELVIHRLDGSVMDSHAYTPA